MARKPRIHFPGACYHVMLRGNAGNDVFFVNQDRGRFLLLLQEGLEKYHHRIHAYCLMNNHVHLIIQVREIALSRIMQNVSFRYTRYVNYRRSQNGHLFQGRYKALLIDMDSYLLELVRYVHNNPVRAGIVKSPESYPWSSHAAYLGKISIPWLTTDWLLSQFSRHENQAIRQFQEFVLRARDNDNSDQNIFYTGTFEGRVLGDDRFITDVLTKVSQKVKSKLTLDQMINAVCTRCAISQDDLSGRSRRRQVVEARSFVSYLVRESEHLSLTDLSRRLNLDLSGLSQAAGRLDKRLKKDQRLVDKLCQLKEDLS